MLKPLVYVDGHFRNNIDLADISEFIKVKENMVWLDVENPTADDIALLHEEFEFHHLSLEDAVHQQQRPKIDEYGAYFFLVAHALTYNPEELEMRWQEVDLFVGRNYVVTVHMEPVAALKTSLERAEKHPQMLTEGVGFLVYSIMDAIIDEYMPILEVIDDQVDDIEEGIFHEFRESAIEDIFKLKRELLKIRRTAAHLRDVFNVLCRRDNPLFTANQLVYFQDIYDHLYRVTDSVDIYREVLSGALEAYLSINANNLNNIMKVFGGWSIILMSGALIAGIYGMNFEFMPELKMKFGYPGALVAMLIVGLIELAIFKKKKWL
ncbi:MAG: magnesium/cobalt transporter CorA [Armatimonadetes bacterium]|nr:magnesium/cobalt transporter CorA [Armatimonadota bacterium]